MNPLSPFQTQIAALCRRFHVERLELFGSATGTRFDPTKSDLDLLVSFERDATDLDNYLGLAEGLEALVGKPVDLVIQRSISNPHFKSSVEATRQLVYARREQETAV